MSMGAAPLPVVLEFRVAVDCADALNHGVLLQFTTIAFAYW